MQIPLDTRPEESAALGRLVGHWGCVENGLKGLLAELLGVNHQKAGLVYKSFVGVDAKITLLRRLNAQLQENEPHRERTEKLLKLAKELNTERNEWVHSLWAENQEGALYKFIGYLPNKPTRTDHKILAISTKEIDNVSRKMSELSSALCQLQIEIQSSIPVQQDWL